MAAQWYYQVMGEAVGPMSASELKHAAQTGKVMPESLVKKGADGDWVLAERVKGLFEQPEASTEEEGEPTGESNDGQSQPAVPAIPPSWIVPQIEVRLPSGEIRQFGLTSSRDKQYYFGGEPGLWRTAYGNKWSARSVRDALLAGEITRNDLARWVEPRPDRALLEELLAPDTPESRQHIEYSFQEWMAAWEKRRSWRPIGDGLAKEEPEIKSLYCPERVCAGYGAGICGIVVGLAATCAFVGWAVINPDGTNELRLPFMEVIVGGFIAALCGMLIGALVGGFGGWGAARFLRPWLPRPPDDGYSPD
jgi:hypothetical protein